MSEKKTKKREGKAININVDIHKMLKIQSTLTEKNMVELVENAILNNMPDEVLAIFNMTKDNKIDKSINEKEDKIEKEINKSSEVDKSINVKNDKSKNEIVNDIDEELAISEDVIDEEISCYL